jgi:hypothetical protein
MAEPDKSPFSELKGLSPEEVEELEQYAQDAKEEYEKTGHMRDLMGLKAFGATDAGVRSAIAIGVQFVRAGLLLRAAEYFSGLLTFEPFHPEVYLWMGLTAQKLKNFTQAKSMYLFSIGAGEEQGLAHVYLGEVLLALGEDKETAAGYLREGIGRLKRVGKNRKVLMRAEKLLSTHAKP